MEDKNKTKKQLIDELAYVHKLIAKFENEILKKEQKLAGIISSVRDHMSMIDEHYNIVWANDVAKRLFGPDLIGKKCYAAYHRRDKNCESCVVEKTFADGKAHEHETEAIGAEGKKMVFWCTASVVARHKNGRPSLVVEISRDITKHKQAPIVVIAQKAFHELYRALNLGGERVEACTLRESHDFIKQSQAGLILLDCGSDVARGLRLLKEIKTPYPDIPIIFLTDDRSSDSAVNAFRAGAREFLEKPVNIFELQNIIKNFLKIKRDSKEERMPFVASKRFNDLETIKTVTTDKPAYILRAIRYIEENLSEKISLDVLAKEANLSKYHFCRLFFRHTAMTPIRFLTSMRIKRAEEFLRRNDTTVSIIAMLVGFNDVGTFIKHFKKVNGVTPAVYRKSLKKAL
jgi:AraC family transcriptional regulator